MLYFSDRVLKFFVCLLGGGGGGRRALDLDPPTYTSHLTGITAGMSFFAWVGLKPILSASPK
jgi:hypothetical protein